MSMVKLRAHAKASGASLAQLDEAVDSDDPKSVMVALLLRPWSQRLEAVAAVEEGVPGVEEGLPEGLPDAATGGDDEGALGRSTSPVWTGGGPKAAAAFVGSMDGRCDPAECDADAAGTAHDEAQPDLPPPPPRPGPPATPPPPPPPPRTKGPQTMPPLPASITEKMLALGYADFEQQPQQAQQAAGQQRTAAVERRWAALARTERKMAVALGFTAERWDRMHSTPSPPVSVTSGSSAAPPGSPPPPPPAQLRAPAAEEHGGSGATAGPTDGAAGTFAVHLPLKNPPGSPDRTHKGQDPAGLGITLGVDGSDRILVTSIDAHGVPNCRGIGGSFT